MNLKLDHCLGKEWNLLMKNMSDQAMCCLLFIHLIYSLKFIQHHIKSILEKKHSVNRASDFFQDRWAKVTHGAKNGGSFFEMMCPSISN